jgi:L-alanine-DL-glutamate epimerase-like enolase superfamily enzyme
MIKISRRNFIGTATGALSAGALGGCGAPDNQTGADKQVSGSVPHFLSGVARENIKITDIKVTPLSYHDPNENLWRSTDQVVWKTDAALCEVFTDQGIVGIGEGIPYEYPDRIKKFTEEIIRPQLIGKNPFDIEFLTCSGTIRRERAPWAGVNNALMDIIGKAKHMPVYQLLATDNEPVTRIPIYASNGDEHEWYNNGEQVLIEQALQYKEMGFTAFKFRQGTDWAFSNMTLDKYINILRRLREAVGPDFKLMHETMRQTGVTIEQLINEFCPALDELHFHWFEDPIGSIDEYARIKAAMSTVKVSGHFSMTNRFDIKRWIDADAVDIIQNDCNITGISENWHVAHMANIFGRIICPHNWHGGLTTMVNAHYVAAIPNRHMMELNMTYNPLKEEIFKEPLTVVDGFMDLPNRPGYGMEVIDDVEKKFPWVPGSYHKPNPRIIKG